MYKQTEMCEGDKMAHNTVKCLGDSSNLGFFYYNCIPMGLGPSIIIMGLKVCNGKLNNFTVVWRGVFSCIATPYTAVRQKCCLSSIPTARSNKLQLI